MANLTLSSDLDTLLQAANFAAARTVLGLGALSTVTPGTGVATALAVNVGSAGAVVVLNGALGTPSSGTLTSATGLPISTGLTGTGTGVLTALAVNVGSAGAFVTFNGAGGTPSSLVLTNATGAVTASIVDAAVTLAKMANLAQDQFIGRVAASTGVPETATITAAARTVLDDTTVGAMVDTLGGASATGTGGLARATSPTFVTPILGTPTSGTVTNLTGTASININGTVGATTPAAGTFTTVVAGSTTSILVGTAGSAVGNIGFRNATSGTATLAPPTGALGTYTVTLPNAASTLPIYGQQITYSGPSAARTVTYPDANFTVARTDAANTFTGASTATSWVFTTPVLGTPTSGTLTNCTGLPAASIVAGILAGNLTLGESTGQIVLDAALSADGTYSGIIEAGTAGATLAFGDLCYLQASDSRWELTDADAESTSGPLKLGMCVLAAAADGSATTMLLIGKIRADANFPALTISAPAYVSTTPGDIQVAQPSGTDDVIRVVGWANTADELYFNPDPTWMVHT